MRLGAHFDGEATELSVFTTTATRVSARLFHADGTPRRTLPLRDVGGGYFCARVNDAPPGTLYKFVLDDREWPDPYARALPYGVHGPAEVTADTFVWQHAHPAPRPLREHVIYELHTGAFTPEGTYAAAADRLLELVRLGVTSVELLPVCAFAGARGWGYDGVMHFAPFAPYGSPDDLRRFVDRAHGLGLAVFLDAVYNHMGPDGNYLGVYSPDYFAKDGATRWGDAPDFGNPRARAYVKESARMWLESYRFDGLRLDATHAMRDASEVHILRELADMAHAMSPPRLVMAEDDMNDPGLVRDHHMDAIWVDDFQRQLHATLTGARDGNYAAYAPGAEGVVGLAETIRRGWLFSGEYFAPWNVARGAPASELPASAFVYGIQNHDHIGNRPCGDRLCHHASLAAYHAAAALLLFLPMTPLLFMGQEWGASSPFLYFTDHHEGLGKLVAEGRRDEFRGFSGFDGDVPDPQAEDTFRRSKLRWEEREKPPFAGTLALYTRLVHLRREDPVLSASGREGLSARAEGELLIVTRAKGDARRVLVVSFASVERDIATLPELSGCAPLLSTAPESAPHVLPESAATIFAS